MAPAPLAIAVPLVVATLLAAGRSKIGRRVADAMAIAAAVAVVALSAVVLARARHGLLVIWMGGWRPIGGVPVGTAFTIDVIGAGTALFAAVLSVGALVFSTRYLDTAGGLFHTLMLVFLAAMVGFAYTGDLFTLFVFFELVTITAFVLVGYQVEQRASLEGSLSFAIVNVLGSFFFLLGIGLVYRRAGTLNFASIGTTLAARPPDALVAVSFALIATGLLTKAAIVPFHVWLADAYAVARTPVCILLAGIMSELGLYAIARVYWSTYRGAFAAGSGALRVILVSFGVATAVVGVGMALQQTHLKRLLAFVVIAYLGLYLIGIGLLDADGLAGTAVFALGDGLVMAALFVAVGVVQRVQSHVDACVLHGRAIHQRATAGLFVVAALVLAGLPPFGPFVGKSLLEHGAVEQGYAWVVPVMIGVTLSAGVALLRATGWVFAGWGQPRNVESSDESGDESEPGSAPFPKVMWSTGAAFLAASLVVGVFPGIARATLVGAERMTDRSSYAASVLRQGANRVAGTTRVPPLVWYDWVYVAISVAGAVLGAVALLRAERRRRDPGTLSKVFQRGIGTIRTLHSGHVGD